MSKITPDKIIPDQDALSKVSSSSKSKGRKLEPSALPSDFSRILSAEMDSIASGETQESSEPGGLPELQATYTAGISRIELTAPDLVPDSAGQVAAILNRLDTYAQHLADPGKSLRQVHGLLDGIDKDIQQLTADTEEGGDTRLKGIIDHMASLVAVEKIKLNRGDYL